MVCLDNFFLISYLILNKVKINIKKIFFVVIFFAVIFLFFKNYFFETTNFFIYTMDTSNSKLIFDGHNIQIRQSNILDTILFSINYFRSDILLMIILFYMYKKNIFKNLIIVVAFLTLMLFIMKIYDAIDLDLFLLKQFKLAGLYIRAIPERFFNLNVILLHLIIIGIGWKAINESNYVKLFIIIFFVILLLLFFLGLRNNFRSNLTLQLFIFIIIFNFFILKKFNFSILLNKNMHSINFLNAISLLNIFSFIFLINFFYSFVDGKFNQFDDLKNEINERSINKFILGPYVLIDGFAPILDLEVEGIVPEQSIQINNEYLYCDPNQKWSIWYNSIAKCFNDKTKLEWNNIKKHMKTKYILFSNKYELSNDSFKLLKKGKKFNIYEIR